MLIGLRTVIYPVLLVLVMALFVLALRGKSLAEVFVERTTGASFVELADGRIASQVIIKIENESDEPRHYGVTLVGAPDASLRLAQPTWLVNGRKSAQVPVFVETTADTFTAGKRVVRLRIDDSAGFEKIIDVTLLGPERGAR